MLPPLGSPLPAGALEPSSRCLLHVDVSTLEESASGLLIAECGHVGTFSRGTTLTGVLDANGVSYTAVDAQLGYELRDDGTGALRLGLRMGTSDRLAFDDPPPLQAHTGLLEFVETGAVVSTAGATLFSIANDAVTGARLWIDTSGTASGFYGLNWHDGTTLRTARLAVRPTTGQRVRLWWTLSPTGVATIRQSINGGADTSAAAAALALPVAGWGSGARARVNARGASANPAQACYHVLKLVATEVDLATLLRLR